MKRLIQTTISISDRIEPTFCNSSMNMKEERRALETDSKTNMEIKLVNSISMEN